MCILMGGSGSTGSSLLKNILNRHPRIFAGGETAFFAKKEVYYKWNTAKKKVTLRGVRGLRNYGYHMYNGTDLLQTEYGFQEMELKKTLLSSHTVGEFSSRFYEKGLEKKHANIWLEKTPANASCFNDFLSSFPDGKVIHMVRNPLDTIASLWERGYPLFYATGIYLLNTSSGLNIRTNKEQYIECRYESLVKSPDTTVKKLCAFLDISFYDAMLKSQGEKITESKLKGWNYDETSNIGTKAIGRFGRLSNEKQDQILEAINRIRISSKGQIRYNTRIKSFKDLCEVLDYEHYSVSSGNTKDQLLKAKKKDQLNRIQRGYMTGFQYPLEVV